MRGEPAPGPSAPHRRTGAHEEPLEGFSESSFLGLGSPDPRALGPVAALPFSRRELRSDSRGDLVTDAPRSFPPHHSDQQSR